MSKAALIRVAGPDRPGITLSITRLLSDHNINVLDIGQAVIHNNLALGILAEIPDSENIRSIVEELLVPMQKNGLSVEYEPVDSDDYQSWVSEQGKPRHIVSLLARKIEAKHISKVTELVVSHGLNIDRITRLSGRVPLGQNDLHAKACVEFSLRGELADETIVRRSLLEMANTLDIDVAYQEDDMFRRNRRLVVFDMDSTLIEAEVIDELAKVHGVGDQVSAITESAMRGDIDFNQSFCRRVELLAGLSESALQQVAGQLRLTEGAASLMSTLKSLGYKTAILSGGFNYFANDLQKRLGFDYVYANDLEIVDGVVTGNVTGDIVDGDMKAALLRKIAEKENIALQQVIAVGDGANDLPMLSIAGLGVAFRAKPLVKASAQQSISNLGLDSILYLLGISDRELMIQ